MEIKKTLLLLGMLTCAAVGTSAVAQSTITIVGEVGSDICDISINGSSMATIQLPKVYATQLANMGDTAGDTDFSVDLSKCDTGQVSQVQMNFSSPSVDPITNRVNTGVNLVSLQILGGGIQIVATRTPKDDLTPGDYSESVDPNGAARLTYTARYYREPGTGSINGNVSAVVNLTVAYK